jgi:tetratricopeptide (TPR) repeat protein
MRFHTAFFAAVFAVLASVPGFPQDLRSWEDARGWLAANPSSPQSGNVLLQSVTLAPTLTDLETLLETHLVGVGDRQKRGEILYRTGQLFETANRFDRASHWYGESVREDPGQTRAMYNLAAVLMELGRVAEARPLLTRVVNNAPTRAQQRSAAILRARAYLIEGDPPRALRHARSLTGAVNDVHSLYLLYESARVAGDAVLEKWSIERLQEEFPRSPEFALLETRTASQSSAVTHFPGPTRILGAPDALRSVPAPAQDDASSTSPTSPTEREATREQTEPQLRGIQTGSFRDPENAQYMVRDIGELGFTATVSPVETDSGSFYRVIISVPEGSTAVDAQELIVRLKEEGIEGFLIFAR